MVLSSVDCSFADFLERVSLLDLKFFQKSNGSQGASYEDVGLFLIVF